MLSPIPIIFVVTALVGIIALVAKRLPELKAEPTLSEHPTWTEGVTIRSIFAGIGERFAVVGKQFYKAMQFAKSEAKSSKDLAGRISQSVRSRFERQRRIKPQTETTVQAEVQVNANSRGKLEKAEDHLDESQYVKAEEIAIEILKNDPGNRDAYEMLGRIYLTKKSFLEAVEVYRYLLRLMPKSETFWAKLGHGLVGLEDYKEAINAYKQSLEIYHQPDVLVSLGLAYQAMGDYSAAGRAFENALDVEPENPQVLMLLAQNFLHRNDTAAAQEVLEQILEIEPGNIVARERLMQLKL